MRIDEYGVLVSEIYPDTGDGWAANRGDSMATTSRWAHSCHIIEPLDVVKDLAPFVTLAGYVRHPDPKMPWKESDIPTDQALPFYVASVFKDQMRERIKSAGWRTGNGDLVTPPFYAILNNSTWKLNLCLIGQLAIFKIPFRWDDGKGKFAASAGSSCDVLNFFHCLPMASRWVRKLVSARWVKEKIRDYYNDEPNGIWLIHLYEQAIDEVLK